MITVEPIVWTIRIGDENKGMYDPYTAVCTAVSAGVDTVRITAMVSQSSQPLSPKQLIAVAKALSDLGFEYAIWERVKDGKMIDTKLPLNRIW